MNPHGGEAARFSKPARRAVSGYLPYQVDPPRIELGSPPRQGGVFPLDHEPVRFQWTAWESNPSHRPCKGQSPPTACRPVCCFERSVRESNPVSVLTTDVCCRNTYRPFHSSDPGWNRTSTFLHVTQASLPLDHGIVVSRVIRVGVEPTKSSHSQRDRFASLRT